MEQVFSIRRQGAIRSPSLGAPTALPRRPTDLVICTFVVGFLDHFVRIGTRHVGPARPGEVTFVSFHFCPQRLTWINRMNPLPRFWFGQ
jgi:hypothetical protein